MKKRQIVASLNKIADSLDSFGLYKESSSITNVMKRIAQEDETSQKLSPFDLGTKDLSNIMDDELNKKQFLMSMRKSATEFAVFVFRTIEDLKLVREKPALYEAVFDMVAKNYPPENYNATPKIAKTLDNIWSEYNKLRDENIRQAPIDEESSKNYGLPIASDKENARVAEQSSQLKGLVLLALKDILETRRAGINTQYMSNKSLVEENTEPAYTSKYSPENVENQNK
jgi:hypothetical protein